MTLNLTFGEGVSAAGDTMTGNLNLGTNKLAFDSQTAARRIVYAINETTYQSDHAANPGTYFWLQAKQASLVTGGNTVLKTKAVDRSDVYARTVTGATNSSPIEITTSASHLFATGDKIAVYGVAGNTAANGLWTITSTAATTFTLTGSTGNGAYTSGGTATNRSLLYAGEFSVAPTVARGGGTGTLLNFDDAVGIVINNEGSTKATDGLYFGVDSGISGPAWANAIKIDVDADQALGTSGAYVNGINLGGTYSASALVVTGTATSYALDFASGTFTAGAIRLKNSSNIFGRNAANSADLSLLGLNASNEIQFDQICRMTLATRYSEGANLTLGTSTGTKFGTAATQKLGFFNATPVVQPTVTGSRGGNAALASLLTQLATLGLVVDSSSA